MHLSILLDMSADALADRPAFSDAGGTITYGELREQARALAHRLQVGGHERTVFLGQNSLAVPRTHRLVWGTTGRVWPWLAPHWPLTGTGPGRGGGGATGVAEAVADGALSPAGLVAITLKV